MKKNLEENKKNSINVKDSQKSKIKIHKSFIFKLVLLVLSAILITVAFYALFSFLALKNIMINLSQLEIFGVKASPIIILGFILLISTLMGCIFSLLMIRGFYKPINKLKRAMNAVSKGKFIKIENNKSDDEVAELIEIYNKMIDDLGRMETVSADFVSNVSHELRTPLSAIKGYAGMLQSPDCSQAEKLDYLNKIMFATDNLSNLTSNILNISRLDNTALLEKKLFSLDEQIRNCILMLENKWSGKNLFLNIELEEILICSNEELCQSIWMNLIGNAIKFTREGKGITINLKAVNSEGLTQAKIEIIDEGIGISKKDIEHVFDRFFQADASRNGEGNGLGLALVKKITQKLGGKIFVESELGKGAKFTVVIPLNT